MINRDELKHNANNTCENKTQEGRNEVCKISTQVVKFKRHEWN
jgi:hypothetical protein